MRTVIFHPGFTFFSIQKVLYAGVSNNSSMSGNFECTQCGLCCLGINSIVKMDKQLSQYGFVVKNDITRETHQALITPEYRDLFETDHSVQEQNPSACLFVRRQHNGKYVCTIHPYRLTICGNYHCCSACIRRNSTEVGKVKGKFSLVSKDEALISLWHEKVMNAAGDPSHKNIAAVLGEYGYSILFYDGE